MSFYFMLNLCHLILFVNFLYVAVQSVNSSSSLCLEATSRPKIESPCEALQHNTYCQRNGIKLDKMVFVTSSNQQINDNKLTTFEKNLQIYKFVFSVSAMCQKAIDIVYCHHYFPRCDSTGAILREERLCRETYRYFKDACEQELKLFAVFLKNKESLDIINCTELPLRNAAMSPECYYFVPKSKENKKGCASYQGNISVTSSGIPCQSWMAQCPHRHSMNVTYPELKNASNFCRNPRSSGQRPWCFTTDKRQRWEYCDIPSCSLATTTLGKTLLPTPTIAMTTIAMTSIAMTTMATTSIASTAAIPTTTIATTAAIATTTIATTAAIATTTIAVSGTIIIGSQTRRPTKMPMASEKTTLRTTTTTNATTKMSVCSPVWPLPSTPSLCTPIIRSPGFYCKTRNIKLDSQVFRTKQQQEIRNESLWRFVEAVDILKTFNRSLKVSETCRRAIDLIYCRYYFPSCTLDSSGRQFAEQKLCHSTCDYLWKVCKNEFSAALKLNNANLFEGKWKYVWDVINCTMLPSRNAGSLPECWYYDGKNELFGNSSQKLKEDCRYFDGSSYQGNVSVTSSGFRCQSWVAQCPHRHTMDSAYPELKNASNFCRNPRGSGERPWCFTTDKNKRWEYCDIPQCVPVNGGYSNWTLSGGCSTSCGKGVEKWTRSCDAPAPKYDGNNCSSLGNTTKYRNCTDLPPCSINGNYGDWRTNSTCNVTCGLGFKLWLRKCDNPSPEYGGLNCSNLGAAEEWRQCSMKPCQLAPKPEGVWQRNASKIVISAVAVLSLVFLSLLGLFVYRRKKPVEIDEDYEPYATLVFRGLGSVASRGVTGARTGPTADDSRPAQYGNLNENGEPIPGASRGIVPYRRPYTNVDFLSKPAQYSKLQLFSSITLDWLRNVWGQVDERGKHVYDLLSRGMQLILPYDKLSGIRRSRGGELRSRVGAIDSNGNAVYDKCDHRSTIISPGAHVNSSSSAETDEVDEAQDKPEAVGAGNQISLPPDVC